MHRLVNGWRRCHSSRRHAQHLIRLDEMRLVHVVHGDQPVDGGAKAFGNAPQRVAATDPVVPRFLRLHRLVNGWRRCHSSRRHAQHLIRLDEMRLVHVVHGDQPVDGGAKAFGNAPQRVAATDPVTIMLYRDT